MIGQLREKLGDGVREAEMLTRHTNFRIGGPARYFFEARSSDELVKAVEVASALGLPYYILGGGSNVLVSDGGFHGLMIKAGNRELVIASDLRERGDPIYKKLSIVHGIASVVSLPRNDVAIVRAEAGVLSAFLARKTAEAGLTGFEWAISLPGTIGGAVFGNAGCFGGEMKDVISRVHFFSPKSSLYHSGEKYKEGVGELTNVDCGFSYRNSIFKQMNPRPIILSAELELKKDDPAACLRRLEEKLRARKEKQPLESSSAGCLFKNFEFNDRDEVAKLESKVKVPEEFIQTRRIPAGWIIDQLGLKDKRIGDAMVSEKHGNFVQNMGSATADQVIQLLAFIKTRARNELGIQLQEEVQYVGL